MMKSDLLFQGQECASDSSPFGKRLRVLMVKTAAILAKNYSTYWPKHAGDTSDPNERDLTTAFASVLISEGMSVFTEVPKDKKKIDPARVSGKGGEKPEIPHMTYSQKRLDLLGIDSTNREFYVLEAKNIYVTKQMNEVFDKDIDKMNNFIGSKLRNGDDLGSYSKKSIELMMSWTDQDNSIDPFSVIKLNGITDLRQKFKGEGFEVDCELIRLAPGQWVHHWLLWAYKETEAEPSA